MQRPMRKQYEHERNDMPPGVGWRNYRPKEIVSGYSQ